MKIRIPGEALNVEIPDEWFLFSEMDTFSPAGTFYPYFPMDGVIVVPISELEPPKRNAGVASFEKLRLVPILMAFASKGGTVPPIDVIASTNGSHYKYRVANGYHRYFASIAAGYSDIAVLIREAYAL